MYEAEDDILNEVEKIEKTAEDLGNEYNDGDYTNEWYGNEEERKSDKTNRLFKLVQNI